VAASQLPTHRESFSSLVVPALPAVSSATLPAPRGALFDGSSVCATAELALQMEQEMANRNPVATIDISIADLRYGVCGIEKYLMTERTMPHCVAHAGAGRRAALEFPGGHGQSIANPHPSR
jgi:hypothetical protein